METSETTAAALLNWYRAMGVDEAIADTPLNWFGAEPVFAHVPAAVAERPQVSLPPKSERRAEVAPSPPCKIRPFPHPQRR